MDRPEEYVKLNRCSSRKDARKVILNFGHLIDWRSDGEDTLLDVGCGPGDVLFDFIIPEIPSFSTSKVFALDISKKMIEYCNEKYKNETNVKFIEMDISKDQPPLDLIDPVDHVTSFYTFHWISDHESTLKNIFAMLKPNGDFLCSQFANFDFFDLTEIMSKSEKWSKYLRNAMNYVSPYYKSPHADKDFKKLMEDVGFCEIKVELWPQYVIEDNIRVFKDLMKVVHAEFDKIPEDLQDEYLTDFVTTGINHNLIRINDHTGEVLMKYKLLVSFGRKKDNK